MIGVADRPKSAHVSVAETGIRGTLNARELSLSVPIERLNAEGASGTLTLELTSVDGNTVHSSASVPYALGDALTGMVEAKLTLPAAINEQADLVDFNVRVSDGMADGLLVTRSALGTLPRYEVRLEGPARLSASKTVSYRVRAHDPKTFAAVPKAAVELSLTRDGLSPKLLTATTDEQGDAFFDLSLADAGNYQVLARALSSGSSESLTAQVAVESATTRALLTTDKPLYQPGQTIHLRSLALQKGDNTPLVGQAVRFEIQDAKGNKIFKRSVTSDAYGIAATTFLLATSVNMGTFKVSAVIGEVSSQKTVEVARYTLPKFGLRVDLDQPFYRAGAVLHGRIDAQYFFGKDVVDGAVDIQAATLDTGTSVFQHVMGKTDASGSMDFAVQLPSTLVGLPISQGNALASLMVSVTDAAGQKVEKNVSVVVTQDGARVLVVPEATALVPGVSNRLFAFVLDPVGAPLAGAQVELSSGAGTPVVATTDAFGQAVVDITPTSGSQNVVARVTLADGSKLSQTFSFAPQPGSEHVLVRSDQAVYDVGATAKLEVVTTEREGSVYVDWLNEGQAIDQRTLHAKDGKASFEVTLDSSMLGNNRVEAYVVDKGGNVVRAGRTLFVRAQGGLKVLLARDKPSYGPGEPAKLTFSVTDAEGKPKVAALGVQVVDEALFSLVDATPGLLRTYFELNDAFAMPQYQIGAPPGSLESLVFDDTRTPEPLANSAAQKRAAATFAALGDMNVTGVHLGSWKTTLEHVKTHLAPAYEARKLAITPGVKDATAAAQKELQSQGCAPTTSYCQKLASSYQALLLKELEEQLVLLDFWGNPYSLGSANGVWLVLTSRGPDEVAGTDDDGTLQLAWSTIGGKGASVGTAKDAGKNAPRAAAEDESEGDEAAGNGPRAAAADAGAAATATPTTSAGGGEAPRVRTEFPETLYVNPAVITGSDGTAQLEVPLADSITQWRVSALANSADGKLGGSADGITVFQDFFADINFPATLTRGDEVTFPIAVYNYLDKPQSVTITLQTASWYAPLGPTTATVELAANAMKGVSFPVRVSEVGMHSLTVKAVGSARSDALKRSVRVVPDGKAQPLAASGALAAETVTHAVSFPDNAVPGSGELVLSVYPAFLSSAVSGMDSMLQTPSGCFEQTTSTTWPNVLVLDYLRNTKQATPEVELKAEAYISAGYQRLVTFEHPGGGFSWFGTQDGKPFLSVTAFGVMEFADMAKVSDVDPAMLSRTVSWLVGQQSADGTWPGDQTEFFSFNTSVVRNTAFVVWALASAGKTGAEVERGLSYLRAHYADEKADGYTLALVANALAAATPSDPSLDAVLKALDGIKKTTPEGKISWDSGGTQTSFYGAGNDAAVTTTALVTHALLLAGGHAEQVKGALDFLTAARDSRGNFGSTQATIWTLRTLLLAATKGTEAALGSFSVTVDGQPFATVALTKEESDVMTTVDLSKLATTGKHDVTLSFAGTGKVSYNLVSNHHLPWSSVPPEPARPLTVKVSYDRASLAVNETVSETVDITNQTAQSTNMVLVDLGIPPGFEVQTDDLDAQVSANKLSKYEVTPRQLVLYVSEIPAGATASYTYRLRATLPIKASDGGAKVYPYYEPESSSQAPATTLQASL